MLPSDETVLRERVRDTVWQPGFLDSHPLVMCAEKIVREMQSVFAAVSMDAAVWTDLARQLPGQACSECQCYWVDTQLRGFACEEQGPEWSQQRAKAVSQASLGAQRAASTSKKGLAELVPRGLAPQRHMEHALQLQSPFDTMLVLDDDAWFAVRTLRTMGRHIRMWRQKQKRALHAVARALIGLDAALRQSMPEGVKRVAATKSPAMMAFLTIILRWPDRMQPLMYVTGFAVVGHIGRSGVFRDLPLCADPAVRENLLGESAVELIEHLEATMQMSTYSREITDMSKEKSRKVSHAVLH